MSVSWPAEATSHRVTVGEEQLHYLAFDGPEDAPTVVCVHGLGGSALNFGALGPLLSARHRVLVLDLPGHGRSAAGSGPARSGDTVDRLVTAVEQLLRQVTQGPVVLLGHSLGGVLAVLLAQRAPDTVGRLVLVAPPVPHRTRLPWDLRLVAKLGLLHAPGVRQVVDRQLTRTSAEELVRKQLADATPHVDRVPPDAVAASVSETRARLASPDAAGARRLQWEAILGTIAVLARPGEWAARLAAVDQPALWLQGHDDLLVPVADATALAASRPAWTFRSRPGVGHLPHLEDPGWVSETLAEWSAGVGRLP